MWSSDFQKDFIDLTKQEVDSIVWFKGTVVLSWQKLNLKHQTAVEVGLCGFPLHFE